MPSLQLSLQLSLLAACALLVGADEPTVEEARNAMRPSLVVVCQRALEHLGNEDWLRARLALTTTRPMAGALDSRWHTQLAPDLKRAVDGKDSKATLNSLLAIVYWDVHDLLAPIAGEELCDSRQAKTRLLKATQDLRYLAPVIRAPRKPRAGQEPVDRGLIYARLEKLLVNAVRQVPSGSSYGRNPQWRGDIRGDAQLFLGAIRDVLPELHGKPTPPKKAVEDIGKDGDQDRAGKRQKDEKQGGQN